MLTVMEMGLRRLGGRNYLLLEDEIETGLDKELVLE